MISITYANTFMSLLTNGMVSMAINDTSYLLLGLVKNVIVEHPDIKKTTDKIDLYNKLIIIDNFMKTIPNSLENNECISSTLKKVYMI